MPLFQPPLTPSSPYTLSNVVANRTFDPTASSNSVTAMFAATVAQDLRTAKILG